MTRLFFPDAHLTRQWPSHRTDTVAVLRGKHRLVCAVRQNGQCTVRLLPTTPGLTARQEEYETCRALFCCCVK